MEPLVVIHNHLFAPSITNHDTCVSPREVVHAPEGVDRQEETVHRVSYPNSVSHPIKSEKTRNDARKEVDDHPAHEHKLSFDDENQRLRRCSQHCLSNLPPSRKRTCNPYVMPNMMIEINGSELLPVATATTKYASYKNNISTPQPTPHQPHSHKRRLPEESTSTTSITSHTERPNTYDRPQQINEHEKAHRETTKAA